MSSSSEFRAAAFLRPSHALPVLLILVLAFSGCRNEAPDESASDKDSADFRESLADGKVTFDLVWLPEADGWIGKTEVTWDEFLLYCDFDEKLDNDVDGITRPSKPLEVHPYDRDWGAGRRPAVGMSWRSAKLYCDWLSGRTGKRYRLPTKKEWLLACGSDASASHGWTAADGLGKTAEVGKKKANPRGLHDMLGNLAEYCAAPDGASPPDPMVLLGGSWKDPADAVSAASTLVFNDDWTLDDPGFPPGQWWIPDGEFIGFRVFCEKE